VQGKGVFRFRHFESGARTQDGSMNMSYLDGHVKSWKYEVNGPIYPKPGGNGLTSIQDGFWWWNGGYWDSN
jgi:prepilin-type processing-associated H-X9-DG protein